jgi:hypothetical protein
MALPGSPGAERHPPADRALRRPAGCGHPACTLADLTDRESDVLLPVAQGPSNAELTDRLLGRLLHGQQLVMLAYEAVHVVPGPE